MDRALLGKLIQDAGLGRILEPLLKAAFPCIRIGTESVDQDTLKLGASRLGGVPDLPAALAWPVSKEREPLAFLAQVRLEDVKAREPRGLLPGQGHLYFFYDAVHAPWGFDPKDRGSWKVFHAGDDVELLRRPFPSGLDESGIFGSCALKFADAMGIPGYSTISSAGIELSGREEKAFDKLLASIDLECGIGAGRHQLLGMADPVQNEMELECQLASNGIFCGGPEGYADPRAKALEKGAADWRLLFQLDSDDSASMMWGDIGMLYFWIKRQDLEKAAFEDVWTILQCS